MSDQPMLVCLFVCLFLRLFACIFLFLLCLFWEVFGHDPTLIIYTTQKNKAVEYSRRIRGYLYEYSIVKE